MFFSELRHAYGRSALLLSGGGNMGAHSFGVAKALWEGGVLPSIISGSSAGSIIASYICTGSYATVGDRLDVDKIDFSAFTE